MNLIVCILLFTEVSCFNNYTSQLVCEFLKAKSSKLCFFFVCWKYHEKVNMQKYFIEEKMHLQSAFLPVKRGIISEIEVGSSFILDLSCENIHSILKEISESNKFRFLYSWLMIGSFNAMNNDVRNLFSNIELKIDMDVNIAIPKSREGQYNILEIYNPGPEADDRVNKIGYFNKGTLSFINKDASYYTSRKNMTGVLLRTGHVVNYTSNLLSKYRNELRYHKRGSFLLFHYHIFLALVPMHNFRFNTTIRTPWFGNESYGGDGGVAKLLFENKIDLSSASGSLRPGRMPNYEFPLAYLRLRSHFFFKNPNTVKPGTQIMKPFSALTWYCSLVAILVMGAAIKVAYWVEHRFLKSNEKRSVVTAFLIIISVISQQGSSIFPQYLGGRIVYLNLLILSIWLYNYYTSSLVSSLLSKKPTTLKTYKELYESGLQVGMENTPYTISYFLQHKNDYYLQKLNSSKIYHPGPNFFTLEEGLDKVKRGGYAFHALSFTAYSVIEDTFDQESICELTEIDLLDERMSSLVLPKKSQYKKLFQISLMKMWENGIFKRERDVWILKKQDCLANLSVASVGKNELFLAYLILFAGLATATVILCIEVIWYKKQKKQ